VLRPHLFGSLEAEFDLGLIDRDAFFRAVERVADIPLLPDEVWIPAWRDIFTPVPSAVAALTRLARDVTPVLVSNTNALHWEGVLAVLPALPRLVPLRALSFETGTAKPGAAHFAAALARAGLGAKDALYADDRPEFVAAARDLGIDGFVVPDPDDLAGELQRRGYLRQEDALRFSAGGAPLFAKGLHEFRAGRFFEAHEEWELLWKESTGDDRIFLQGLIQLAAARVHLGRGNPAPAARLLALAKAKLDRFGDEEVHFLRDLLSSS
jgi:FMN phosphatase YigB (HAD superfamily)